MAQGAVERPGALTPVWTSAGGSVTAGALPQGLPSEAQRQPNRTLDRTAIQQCAVRHRNAIQQCAVRHFTMLRYSSVWYDISLSRYRSWRTTSWVELQEIVTPRDNSVTDFQEVAMRYVTGYSISEFADLRYSYRLQPFRRALQVGYKDYKGYSMTHNL